MPLTSASTMKQMINAYISETNVSLSRFISDKVPELLALADALLAYRLSTEELENGIWDLMEGWLSLGQPKTATPSDKERVFWDLLGMMHRHAPYQLRGHMALRQQLTSRMDFLRLPSAPLPANLSTPAL
ncbi:hypothetical protein EDC28_11730 [Gallaecimonas pentaromativorans]|uniref:Uncharacterized protein n=2 Tax=Gallaecimonas pentaromativorans TaxID=584787 RepID=A0A3N1NFU1_9GAMM|nr:hypothetical protein EDC28_11730 [Gallaecimonas pentaromativorans]